MENVAENVVAVETAEAKKEGKLSKVKDKIRRANWKCVGKFGLRLLEGAAIFVGGYKLGKMSKDAEHEEEPAETVTASEEEGA